MAPSCGIGILLNLSISGGLMPTFFVGQSMENIQKAQTTLQQIQEDIISPCPQRSYLKAHIPAFQEDLRHVGTDLGCP
jgi:hypothetical protein